MYRKRLIDTQKRSTDYTKKLPNWNFKEKLSYTGDTWQTNKQTDEQNKQIDRPLGRERNRQASRKAEIVKKTHIYRRHAY